MRTKGCLDEAAIQAYLDGELAPEAMATAARHTAACADCAAALEEAQGELSLFASAFGAEADLAVPTERLRARVDDAVASLRPAQSEQTSGNGWNFGALVGSLTGWLAAPFALAPRRVGAFAGLAALVALAFVFGLLYTRRPDVDIAKVNPGGDPAATQPSAEVEQQKSEQQKDSTDEGSERQTETEENTPAPKVLTPAPRRQQQQRKAPRAIIDTAAARREEIAKETTTTLSAPAIEDEDLGARKQYVPGEANYVRAVASLEKMIEVGGDRALRPNVRADYERNLAVIDKAIEQTRRAALRNPKDQDAAAYLFSSYQTKIDLMRSLADQAQVATLGR